MALLTLATSAARTTNGDSGTAPWGVGGAPNQPLRVQLDVTAASGTTPTLNVFVEDSLDGGVTWNSVGTFTQRTTTGREAINIQTPFADQLRVRWALGGTTPSFTFSVIAFFYK